MRVILGTGGKRRCVRLAFAFCSSITLFVVLLSLYSRVEDFYILSYDAATLMLGEYVVRVSYAASTFCPSGSSALLSPSSASSTSAAVSLSVLLFYRRYTRRRAKDARVRAVTSVAISRFAKGSRTIHSPGRCRRRFVTLVTDDVAAVERVQLKDDILIVTVDEPSPRISLCEMSGVGREDKFGLRGKFRLSSVISDRY